MHDGGEIVVGQNHVGGLLGNFSSGNTHGNADRGGFEGRSIVYTITSHRSHLSFFFQKVHQVLFISWICTRECTATATLHEYLLLLIFGQCHELFSCVRFVGDVFAVIENSNLFRNGLSCFLVISSDHNDADASRVAHGNGTFHFSTSGILDTSKAKKSHARFHILEFIRVDLQCFVCLVGMRAVVSFQVLVKVLFDCHREDAQGARCHVGHLSLQLCSQFVVKGNVLAVAVANFGAPFNDRFRRTLAKQNVVFQLFGMSENRHRFAASRKLQSCNSFVFLLVEVGRIVSYAFVAGHLGRASGVANLFGQDFECSFGRFTKTEELVFVSIVLDTGVVAQCSALSDVYKASVSGSQFQTINSSPGVIRSSTDVALHYFCLLKEAERYNRHFVQGQGTSFVGADHSRTAESLDRGELADDCVALHHFFGSQGEAESDDSRETFWDSSDTKSDSNFEVVNATTKKGTMDRVGELLVVHDPHSNADQANNFGQIVAELV
mmetsp:Transcript_38236/g.75275  ORF Transcript_38236/g.75275 Transcript_38236/m.75275 type:complete len:495 (-) Transcript_38236:791-2275(-)